MSKVIKYLLLGVLPLMLFLIFLFISYTYRISHPYSDIIEALCIFFALFSYIYLICIAFKYFRALFYLWLAVVIICAVWVVVPNPTGNMFFIPAGIIYGFFVVVYGIPIIGIVSMLKDIFNINLRKWR